MWEIIAKELSEACQNDKAILAFPCIISALCRRAAVPARPADKYTMEKSGWIRKEYMRKMEVADAMPIQMVMPTPPASEQAEPSAPAGAQPSPATSLAPTPTATPATPDSRQSTPNSPLDSAPTPPPSPPPACSKEAAPYHILQLRSQLQGIEARQLQFMEETKVFQTSFINFLCFQFPNAAAFFTAHPTTTQPTNFSTATQPNRNGRHLESSTAQKRKEPVPAEGKVAPVTTTATIATARRRGKTPAGRIMISDRSSNPEKAEQPPAKRQRRYHVITTDSDDDSSAGLPVAHPEQSADPSLSHTF
ncbi:hypothetical protein V6N13_023075 [Hibiscus sabdariffa]